jgi:hypothetical protein
MADEPLVFKNVRGGAPIAPAEVPKLPPAALSAVLARLREKANGSEGVAIELAVDVVYYALRRLDPSLTRAQIADDEDFAVVERAYDVIQAANPNVFREEGQA